jgi:hypothetical protein
MVRWRGVKTGVAAVAAALLAAAAAQAAEAMLTTDDLLKNPQFKSAYSVALGPRAKERWLAALSNSAPVRSISVAGVAYQVATPCKPHDCAESNLMLLFAPGKGWVYGKLYEKGRSTLIGGPDAAMAAELETLWKKEFRQQ